MKMGESPTRSQRPQPLLLEGNTPAGLCRVESYELPEQGGLFLLNYPFGVLGTLSSNSFFFFLSIFLSIQENLNLIWEKSFFILLPPTPYLPIKLFGLQPMHPKHQGTFHLQEHAEGSDWCVFLNLLSPCHVEEPTSL